MVAGEDGVFLVQCEAQVVADVPGGVQRLDGVPRTVDDVAVGSQHTLALARDGRLFAFGCNGRGALGRNPSALNVTATPVEVSTPETFVSVAAAGAHSVGLTAGGAVYTWGANHEGQLGACEVRGREERRD